MDIENKVLDKSCFEKSIEKSIRDLEGECRIIKVRYDEIDKRLCELEKLILPEKKEIVIEKPPKSHLTLSKYCKKYLFISLSSLFVLLKNNKPMSFKKYSGKFYVNPVEVSILFEKEDGISKILINKYKCFKNLIPDLKKKGKIALEIIKKEKEN